MLSSVLLGSVAVGAPVRQDEALSIARGFVGEATGRKLMRKAPVGSEVLKLAYSHVDEVSGINAFYVFNRGTDAGYILVAADDRAPIILGYSDSGTFDSRHIPQSMQGMIQSWSDQISWLVSHPECKAAVPSRVGTPVEPLLGEIQWDQGDPYNRKCPTVTQYDMWGDVSGKGPAATGCVATALGQIMYYHKWPETGKGSVSYKSEGMDETMQVSCTFEGVKYNWDAMLPKLTSKSPSDAIYAVSTLLFHVGAAFESAYGASTGATDVSVAPALLKYFNYDQGISYVNRDYYTSAEWDAMLMEELWNRRPVAYGGVTRKFEGHFFVLDGVNADGYYHVNWGWSGMEDGYYMLSLLEPGTQGIGGASGGAFHYAQNMIIGIQKPVEGSTANYNFTCDGLGKVNATVGRQETVKLTATGCWNNSAHIVTANLGFMIVDSEGKVVHRQMVTNAVEYGIGYGKDKLECSLLIPDNIAPGNYTVRPAYQVAADGYADRFMLVTPGRISQYKLEVTEEKLTYSSEGTYALSILSVRGDNEGPLENGITKKVIVRFRNEGGEFHGPVQLRFFIKGKERVYGYYNYPSAWNKAIWISIPGYSESELSFDVGSFDLPGSDNWVVRLIGNEGIFGVDEDGYQTTPKAKTLCSMEGVKVVGPALPPVLELVDDMIVTTAIDGKVPRNDVGVKICVNNEGGEWTGRLRMSVDDPDVWSRDPLGYVTFDPVTIAGETDEQWITLTGGELPDACVEGKLYELVIREPDSNDAMIPSWYFRIEVVCGPAVEKVAALSLDEVVFVPEKVVAGTPAEVQFHISNTGYAYNGGISFTVSRGGEIVHTSASKNVSIARDDDSVIAFNETFELPTYSDYVLVLLDNDNKEIGKRENLTFIADESSLAMTDATILPETVDCGKDMEYIFGVRNSGFRFDSNLHFVIILDDEVKFSSESKPLILARGEEDSVKFNAVVNLPDGSDYIVRLLTADDTMVGERKISIRGFVGVADILSDEDVPVRYFNLQGVEIESPAVGQPVIIVKGTKTMKAIFN